MVVIGHNLEVIKTADWIIDLGHCVANELCESYNISMDVEAEIRDLKRRVSELEGSFGFLTRQVQGVHKDLLEFEALTEQRFDQVDKRFDRLEQKVDGLDRKIDTKIDGLAKALPVIVGDELRQALREDRERKR